MTTDERKALAAKLAAEIFGSSERYLIDRVWYGLAQGDRNARQQRRTMSLEELARWLTSGVFAHLIDVPRFYRLELQVPLQAAIQQALEAQQMEQRGDDSQTGQVEIT